MFYSDLDSDGDFDAIVEVFFCEKRSCHPTTGWSELIVYLRGKKGYSFAASKGYDIYGKINSIIQSRIYMDIYGFDEDDPQCCPRIKGQEILRLKGKRLVKVKN